MANSNSRLPIATHQNLTFLVILFIFSLSHITIVKSDSLSFNFPTFEPGLRNILTDGEDANITSGILQLTKKDQYGIPIPHRFGLAGYYGSVHISDKESGRVADFTTEFTFVVNPKGPGLHGDGFTFFLASLDFEFADNATGGFLGLFNEETAFNTSLNKVVAVEFDSFANEWDPNFPVLQSPHIGIDVNSIRSAATAPWPSEARPQGAIAKARISYSSYSKQLSVFVFYPNSPVKGEATLSFPVNLVAALQSDFVIVGFSASTGEFVETHDILSWSFTSSL
ncbi:hypothetical protein RIF29_36405 [Crotalaria pallida]|uniref:Legume lectin domain-containing protein n=1 Tax=Crotalaria pallida TaxID=3830 RepID=A0AAN9HYJ0_CROPI